MSYRQIRSLQIADFSLCPTVLTVGDTGLMTRELENRIQQLCAQIVATDNDEEMLRLCIELQKALSEHAGRIRDQVADYRTRSEGSPPKKGE
jgi:hypothetical protein